MQMERRAFDFLIAEMSLAVGQRVPRYDLWLWLQELGVNPIDLSQEDLLAFHDGSMRDFLAICGLQVRDRTARRLRGLIRRYDPTRPTPEEIMERISSALWNG